VGSGSVDTHRSKCLCLLPSFLPSLPLYACVRACMFVSVWILCFFVFWGETKIPSIFHNLLEQTKFHKIF
jgi:hypothetical protein